MPIKDRSRMDCLTDVCVQQTFKPAGLPLSVGSSLNSKPWRYLLATTQFEVVAMGVAITGN